MILLRPRTLWTVLAAILIAAAVVFFWPSKPDVIVTPTTEKTTTVQVEAPTIVTRDVIKYVEDDANVKRLLDENKKLKIQVTQLSETIARHVSTGGGKGVTVPTNTLPPDVQPGGTTSFNFSDYRLNFAANLETNDVRYKLTQRFEVLSTSGRNKQGVPVSLVKLYEIGPGDTRTEIADTKTVSIFADDTRPKWHVSPTLIAGFAYTADVATGTKSPGGVVGARWLTRGRTKSAEDSTWSLVTPVALLSEAKKEFGILPVSVNLGRVKYQPFKDLWVSPYVGIDVAGRKASRFGLAVTASF